MRGEDKGKYGKQWRASETPPRAWGRLVYVIINLVYVGNTPTCVGKTSTISRPARLPWKHPHVRGEDNLLLRVHTVKQETPPRAWGRHRNLRLSDGYLGNTPTCVGKTCQGRKSVGAVRETPPRAWGRPQSGASGKHSSRNTPTCVGKTLRDYSLFLLSRQNNIETSSFSDTSCSPDNSMSWRFGSPMP